MIHQPISASHAWWRQWAASQRSSDAVSLRILLDTLLDFERQKQPETVLAPLRVNVFTLIGKLLWDSPPR